MGKRLFYRCPLHDDKSDAGFVRDRAAVLGATIKGGGGSKRDCLSQRIVQSSNMLCVWYSSVTDEIWRNVTK
jgi:tRNA U34 5-methylaminomethyl-2-thiouridine-forming methyltransferase MnmC